MSYPLTIPPGLGKLKITLVWTDPAAAPNSSKALVNDLDLSLSLPAENQTWLPWVLNSSASIDSLTRSPHRGRDSLNNIEQITIDKPLKYSLDKGNVWQIISSAVPISQGYFKWDTPDTNAGIILRMDIGNAYFLSDTVTISGLPVLQIGFNCQDSFLLSWNRMQRVDSFRVFKLGERYMEKLVDVAGTDITLNKAGNPSLYYAVSPLIHGREGVRSQSVDYAGENIGCFIKAFEGNIAGNIGILQLELGTIKDVRSITWQKASPNGFRIWQIFLFLFTAIVFSFIIWALRTI